MKTLYLFVALALMSSMTIAQPTNDDCTSAEVINVTSANLNVSFDINTASINNEVGCSGATTSDYADVWFTFTMPFNGNLYIEGNINWNNFALYDTCGGTEIQCGNTNEFYTDLTSGNTYILRIYRTSATASNTGFQNFSIRAFEEVTNDDCASAETITVTTETSSVNFSIGGATINNEAGCSGNAAQDYLDIWYDFTMPVNGNLYLEGHINWNNFALYEACDGIEIQCGNTNEFYTGLISGTNYKLRLYRTRANADNGFLSFTIKAFEEIANDDCESAETITVTTETSTVNFSIGGAAVNNEAGCTGNPVQDYVDIWYDFTMPVNGNLYLEGHINWNNFTLYDGCGGNEIQCGNTNELYTGLTSGTNYKLRVFRTRGAADNNFLNFNIKAFEEVANDDCESAEIITVNTETTVVNFSIGGATINNEIGCSGSSAQDYLDIWYEFTMPINGDLVVEASINWNNFALYEACNGTEIQCGNNNEIFTSLTSGDTYILRLFRTRSNADNGFLSFTIYATDTLSTNTVFMEDTVRVFPNPSKDIINISIHKNENLKSVQLFNLLGEKIKESQNSFIDVKSISSGLYLMGITTNLGHVTKRVVILD